MNAERLKEIKSHPQSETAWELIRAVERFHGREWESIENSAPNSATGETVKHACGANTSACPRLDLIPREAMVRMAERFEVGLKRYGKDNWRAGLKSNDYVAERVAHLMNHAARFLAKMDGRLPDDEEDEEDDAGAILWAGAFLAARTTCQCGVKISPIQHACDDCADALKQVTKAAQ